MAAFNVVRVRVKPGYEQQFIDFHRKPRPGFKGFDGGWLVKTGDQTFCIVGQWKSFQSIVKARPEMIGILDEMRGMLDDLGGGLGVTDPVSGEAVARFGMKKKAAKKRPSGARRKTKRARRR
jgi:hypothetical protein